MDEMFMICWKAFTQHALINGKLLKRAREFTVCMENMHGYTVSHVLRNISEISFCVMGPWL